MDNTFRNFKSMWTEYIEIKDIAWVLEQKSLFTNLIIIAANMLEVSWVDKIWHYLFMHYGMMLWNNSPSEEWRVRSEEGVYEKEREEKEICRRRISRT
mgnify:CR=1 FL=1